MSVNFAFYVHHHGSGHVMRAISIAKKLPPGSVAFLGSGLTSYRDLIPENISCFNLPGDIPVEGDRYARSREVDFLHYAPLNVQGAAQRAAQIITILGSKFPVLLIVDVSVEVTLLAALSGIPTIVMRQNGDRNDIPHLNAYQSAQLLLAPSSKLLMKPPSAVWVDQKTFYSGGFSRYTNASRLEKEIIPGYIGVMTGTGGTSINARFVAFLAVQCQSKTIHVIGEYTQDDRIDMPGNVITHGRVENPAYLLNTCEVVIGNAGHNTVMEMADLDKYFICVPESRPFDEQLQKAILLEDNQMALVVDTTELFQSDWSELIGKALTLPTERWLGVIDPNALSNISDVLIEQYNNVFPNL